MKRIIVVVLAAIMLSACSLTESKISVVVEKSTALSTYTPYPTYTIPPTYTALPTYTYYPTATKTPTVISTTPSSDSDTKATITATPSKTPKLSLTNTRKPTSATKKPVNTRWPTATYCASCCPQQSISTRCP